MSLTTRWISDADLEPVAEARTRSFGSAGKDLGSFRDRLTLEKQTIGGDSLIVEREGQAAGTATVYDLAMWVRGGRVACQAVGYVGTLKTERRKSAAGANAPGVATAVMNEVLRRGRERGQVVSALMPFRVSFYEHFGYGAVERRCDWTIPASVLPGGSTDGVRFYAPSDLAALTACRQRMVEQGQCDIERTEGMWRYYIGRADDGFLMVDRPEYDGPVHGWVAIRHEQGNEALRVSELGYDGVGGLRRLLQFLGNQRDQYPRIGLSLQADFPLHRLLREPQIVQPPSRHAAADARLFTRMQVRVLDHKRLLESMRLATTAAGQVDLVVHESEGDARRLRLHFADGRISVSDGSSAGGFESRDHVWAAIACGELSASDAVALGVASGSADQTILLDTLASGPRPHCLEYF